MLREPNWKDRLLFLVGLRKAYRVDGDSMAPTIANGDVVLIIHTKAISAGDIVLVQHPYKKGSKMIKRVGSVSKENRITLIGDNGAESTDSRAFGTVPLEYVYGKAVCRLS